MHASAALSLERPSALPPEAPQGRRARALPSERYVDHPGYGLTPQRIVAIYRLAEAGWPQQQCDLIDDIVENDCHLRDLFEGRSQAVAGKPFTCQAGAPGEREERAARVLDAAMRKLEAAETFEHQLTMNRYGYAAAEIDWDVRRYEGADWVVPVWFARVPARRFRIGDRQELRLLTTEFSTEGEPLEPGKWWVTKRSGHRLARSGLGRTVIWPAHFKRKSTADWFIYIEKYGLPLTLVKYLLEADETSKAVGRKIIEDLAEDGGAMITREFEIDVKDVGRGGDAEGTHGAFISWCNREMSKAINGSTLSNDNGDSGGASYALGDVHDGVRWERVLYDHERLQQSFGLGVAVPFMQYNGLADLAAPILRLQVVRDLSPRARAEIAKILADLGMRLSDSQLRQELGYREPLDDKDAIERPAAPAPSAAAEPAAPPSGGAG